MTIRPKILLFACLLFFSCGRERAKEKNRPMGSARVQPFCGNRDIRPEGIMLDIRFKNQECDNWCWAAVISMVSAYYGHEAEECSLASLRLDNLFQCCTSILCGSHPCDEPANHEDVGRLLQESAGLKSGSYLRPITEDSLQIELSNGRPVIVGFNGVESSHAAIVAGFRPPEGSEVSATYLVLDPSLGLVNMDYEDLRMGPTMDEFMPWVMTWKNISPRADGCNERFDPLCGCEPSP